MPRAIRRIEEWKERHFYTVVSARWVGPLKRIYKGRKPGDKGEDSREITERLGYCFKQEM